MPRLLKIGLTRGLVKARAAQLFRTGTPTAFDIRLCVAVEDVISAERSVHSSLGRYRYHPRREFFEVDLDAARSALMLHAVAETTEAELGAALSPASTRVAAAEEQAAAEGEASGVLPFGYSEAAGQLVKRIEAPPHDRVRAPPINLIKMGLRPGDRLRFIFGGDEAEVRGPQSVHYLGRDMSLSKATQIARRAPNHDGYSTRYWECEGIGLRQLYSWWTGEPMMPIPTR